MAQKDFVQNIEKAQRRIEEAKPGMKHAKMRQHYHFMAQQGWLNDPNGLIFFRGQYHFFYQYNPYDAYWGAMHWGHAVSEDLLHWEHLEVALAPSEEYDNHERGGCFSGSAIEHDGRLYLFYTSAMDYGDGFVQAQCMAYSEDGIHFVKHEANPIIPNPPAGYETGEFRDPKVWKHEDTFYMVCSSQKDKLAAALLYRSKDLVQWEFFNVLAESRGELGFMWECPDFFQLEDKHVLTFSPMGVHERKAMYLLGDMNYETGKFVYSVMGEIDWGFDYYAPQSFCDKDGRRIVVGWANGWDWMPWWKDWGPTFQEGWCGAFSLPREVRLCQDNTLQFQPVKELETIREEVVYLEDKKLEQDRMEIQTTDRIACEFKIEIDLSQTTADVFSLHLRSDGDRAAIINFDLKNQMMYFDRNHSDGWSTGITRSPLILKDKEVMDIHVFVDRSSIEVYTDEYKTIHSGNVFANEKQNKNYIVSPKGILFIKSISAWGLKKTVE